MPRLVLGLSAQLPALAVLLAATSGCLQGTHEKADLDDLIDDVWLVDFETQDAIEFLERGGTHYDSLGDDARTVDAEVVLPFLVRLRDEFQVGTVAVLETDENWAWVLLVKLPANPGTRQQIEEAIRQTDASFDGVISTEWGHRWLAINFAETE